MIVHAENVETIRDAVRAGPRVLPAGGRTKPALSGCDDDEVVCVDTSGLSGVLEFDPGELTVTALAGTPIAELGAALAEHHQHLPFDPPLGASGATLGGTVAAGLSGPGAFSHGGVRDFVIGVRLIDGTGTLVAGGGKVVKNAAGFDLPKLMVGSMGRLGIITELSLKVFPKPPATATFVFATGDLTDALAAVARVGRSTLDVQTLDLEPPGRLVIRIADDPATTADRVARLGELVGARGEQVDDAAGLWGDVAEFRWVPAGHTVIRAALTPHLVPAVHELMADAPARYVNAANVAWLAWPGDRRLDELDRRLDALAIPAMRVTGPAGRPLIGARRGGAFAERVRRALDPDNRFLEL